LDNLGIGQRIRCGPVLENLARRASRLKLVPAMHVDYRVFPHGYSLRIMLSRNAIRPFSTERTLPC
jgi:hypothetical protein